MDKCPHCGESTITVWHKFCAGPASPVKCRKCDGLSHIHHAWEALLPILTQFSLAACIIVALYLQSFWPILAIPVPMILLIIAAKKWAILKPISYEKARQNRTRGFLFLLVLFILILLAGVIDHFAN